MSKIIEINPSTEEIYKEFEETSFEEIDEIVRNARNKIRWKNKSIDKRIEIVKNIINLLEEKKEKIARKMALEIGKPLKAGRHEVDITKKRISDFCLLMPDFIKDVVLFENESEKNVVSFEPLGTVVVISPWNAPVFVPFASIIPALLTGNKVIFKPSEYSCDTGLLINEIFREVFNGKLSNVFQTVIGGKDIGRYLVENDIDMTVLIGSYKAGKEIIRSSAEGLKKFILELGGKDPAIILEDADIDRAAKEIVKSGTMYTGQVCFGVERVYCHYSVYDEFLEKCKEEMEKIKVGNPLDEETDIGPFSVKFQFEKVLDHLDDALEKGASIVYGCKRIGEKGFFLEPGILENVNHSMKIMKEETFGPLIPIMKFSDINDAIQLANDSDYGLTASIWTSDLKKGEEIVQKIEAGTVEINHHGMSKAGCPWGGYKKSGFGRIYSKEGIRSFMNVKHVWEVK